MHLYYQGSTYYVTAAFRFSGESNHMEIGLALLSIAIGLLLVDQKPPKKEEPKDEVVYKIEVKRPK